MSEKLTISNLNANRCEKVQGFVDVGTTNTKMPVTLINGKVSGKTILITAGIHGGEYPCIQTAIELGQELEPEDVSGQIIIVHPVNTQGFEAMSPAIVPEDGKNINREFPGKKDGTISEQIAYMITNEFQAKSDFYLDLHGGDIHESLTPFVFYPGVAQQEVINMSYNVASILDVKYMVKSRATTGAYNSGAIKGLPGILIERGQNGLWNHEEVKAYKKDVINVLSYLKVLEKDVVYPNKPPHNITKAIYLNAISGGCWYPKVKPGDKVSAGQELGEIKDFFGNVIDAYVAEVNGVILYMASSLAIQKDAPLVAYGEL